MKILVTGSEGSLMQAVIPYLIANGHEVVGVDSLFRYNERMNLAKGYDFEKIDLTNPFDVDSLIGRVKPDYIIQAAARIFGVGGFNKYCADILYNDPMLHGNILQSSVKWKVKRVVYISSSMVYENCPQSVDIPVYEDMVDKHPAPYTEYGMSKYVGERMSIAYKKQYDLDYTIWRPFNIITPYEKSEGNIGTSHVFADYIKHIVIEKKNPLPIIGDGSQIRCFTWIDDIARMIGTESFDDRSLNETFNLGNPEPFTMKQLAHIIHSEAVERGLIPSGNISFETVADYFADVKVRIPDISKAEGILNFKPTKKLQESIKYCLDHLKNNE
jgi:nucleoside-diphosphate-sugar epimerase